MANIERFEEGQFLKVEDLNRLVDTIHELQFNVANLASRVEKLESGAQPADRPLAPPNPNACYLCWVAQGQLSLEEIPENAELTIGRQSGATLILDDQSVSRRHAVIRSSSNGFLIENQSQINQTRINGKVFEGNVILADGDILDIGPFKLVYLNTASAKHDRGLTCGSCGRENSAINNHCWYCGNSLANALTSIYYDLPVICRVISASLEFYDIYKDEILAIRSNQRVNLMHRNDPGTDVSAVVQLQGGSPIASPGSNGDTPSINGINLSSMSPIQTGDDLVASGAAYTFVVRQI